ncbi:hypothetical protein F8388_009496 [Cannabis sativa]|nr:hypothetical protein F8388_009496 [Cannabis sativa]
MRDSVC